MNVMTPLHAALDLRRDQQTHRDRKDVKKKLPVSMDLAVERVNIQHVRSIPFSFVPPTLAISKAELTAPITQAKRQEL
jgi:hypothetical protein